MSILIFLAVLFLLVLVHEFGHFIVAKLTGMRVDEFGIGFPPRLFGIKRGETEYTFNMFPVGGFVKIFGEDGTSAPSSPVSSETRDRRSEALAEAGEERNIPASGQHRYDEDEVGSRAFGAKSKWAQAAVLVAGVSMNVLFAWLLFTFAFSLGVKTEVSEADARDTASLVITQVIEKGPAAEAHLKPGSTITSVGVPGENLTKLTPAAFSAFMNSHRDQTVTIAYRYNNEVFLTALVPKTGVIAAEPDRAAIGIALSLIDVLRDPIHIAAWKGFTHTMTGLKDITLGIGKLLFDTVRFKADLSQVAGPVGIVGLVGEASAFGLTSLLLFTAFISLNLAVINVLPFPALDGGRLLFVMIEAVRRKQSTPAMFQW